MKKAFLIFAFCIMSAFVSFADTQRNIAVQTYSFRNFTLTDAIQQLKSIGVDQAECYTGQLIGGDFGEHRFQQTMDKDARADFKKYLDKENFKIISIGCINPPADENNIRQLFEFAQFFGVKYIATESRRDALEIMDKLAEEYGLTITIHNHTMHEGGANPYCDPHSVLKEIKGLKNVYAGPDIGHWGRSCVNPVWGYRALKGKIKSTHFKDISHVSNLGAPCVPFGTGDFDLPAILAELDSQNYTGLFVIEYESEPENPLPAIKTSVEYLRARPKK